jgi:hypothetical protein
MCSGTVDIRYVCTPCLANRNRYLDILPIMSLLLSRSVTASDEDAQLLTFVVDELWLFPLRYHAHSIHASLP